MCLWPYPGLSARKKDTRGEGHLAAVSACKSFSRAVRRKPLANAANNWPFFVASVSSVRCNSIHAELAIVHAEEFTRASGVRREERELFPSWMGHNARVPIDPVRNLHGYRARSDVRSVSPYRMPALPQTWRRLSRITCRYRPALSKDGITL
jgi:hypothetical protein